MTSTQATKGQALIAEIRQLAASIKKVPRFGVDVHTMGDVHKKCAEIDKLCKELVPIVGTGDGKREVGKTYPDTGN